jgi:hypothetical protein
VALTAKIQKQNRNNYSENTARISDVRQEKILTKDVDKKVSHFEKSKCLMISIV